MVIILLLMAVFLSAASASSATNVANKDNPANGEYVFPLEQVWQTDAAGDTPFGRLSQLYVSGEGNLFVRDLKNKAYFIFDRNGKFVKSFGALGEGPGEVKNVGRARIMLAGDKVVIVDSDKILYFNQNGEFIRSVINNTQARPPVVFLNEDEFISAPQTIMASADGNAKLKHINLKTGKEKVITDFSLFKGGVVQQGNMRAVAIIPSITPVMVVGKLDNTFYFGMNDKYNVYKTDLDGKDLGSFSLTRQHRKVTLKQKEQVMSDLIKGLAPEEFARHLAKALPGQETYFSDIQAHEGKLYLYKSAFVPGDWYQLDIFSPAGKYLYRGIVKVNEGYTMVIGPTIKNGFMYIGQEDEEGEITIGKYKTVLPK